MTAVDLARVAAALREARLQRGAVGGGVSNWNAALDSAALKVGRTLGADDPLFNLQRFLDECGVPR